MSPLSGELINIGSEHLFHRDIPTGNRTAEKRSRLFMTWAPQGQGRRCPKDDGDTSHGWGFSSMAASSSVHILLLGVKCFIEPRAGSCKPMQSSLIIYTSSPKYRTGVYLRSSGDAPLHSCARTALFYESARSIVSRFHLDTAKRSRGVGWGVRTLASSTGH